MFIWLLGYMDDRKGEHTDEDTATGFHGSANVPQNFDRYFVRPVMAE